MFWTHGGLKASLQIPSVAGKQGLRELLPFKEAAGRLCPFPARPPWAAHATSVMEPGLGQRPVPTLPGEQAEWLVRGIPAPHPETVVKGGHQAPLKGH